MPKTKKIHFFLTIPMHAKSLSLVIHLVKNLPKMQETPVQFLGQEDPLEKEMATHSSIWPGESYGLYSQWGHKESDPTE